MMNFVSEKFVCDKHLLLRFPSTLSSSWEYRACVASAKSVKFTTSQHFPVVRSWECEASTTAYRFDSMKGAKEKPINFFFTTKTDLNVMEIPKKLPQMCHSLLKEKKNFVKDSRRQHTHLRTTQMSNLTFFYRAEENLRKNSRATDFSTHASAWIHVASGGKKRRKILMTFHYWNFTEKNRRLCVRF